VSAPASPTHNDIPRHQNSAEALDLLAAFSQVYGEAKRRAGLELDFAVLAPVALTILTINHIVPGQWADAYALLATFSQPLFDRAVQQKQRLGACIQELFDNLVFDLPWHASRCGAKPDPEDVIHATQTYRRHRAHASHLENWYPSVIAPLPLDVARLVCQRANCRWDETLRRSYAASLLGTVGVVLVALLLWGVGRDWTVAKCVGAAVPLSPAILWMIQEGIRQRDAATVDGTLKDRADALWARAIREDITNHDLRVASRELQDAIFDRRNHDPVVFNWFHRLTRSANEHAMRGAAEQMTRDWSTTNRA
jgi:hypothetical protein